MSVKLRQRHKGDKTYLYLDTYHKGQRKTEHLKFFLHRHANMNLLSREQKQENKERLRLANEIRVQREHELQVGQYGLQDLNKQKMSLFTYLHHLAELRRDSKGNYDNWDSMLKHLRKYQTQDISIGNVTKQWIEGFRSYLMTKALTPSGSNLSANSQCSYYNKLRAGMKQAVKDNILIKNPAEYVQGIKPGEPEREFLTEEEIQNACIAHCELPILKSAFLFSCLTGLRWSDIQKLTWSELRYDQNYGHHIRYKQQKTKSFEVLPIPDNAMQLLPAKGEDADRVFHGLKYSAWNNLKLQQWMHRAGITKTITFHCARHTYATLLLSKATDIYTVQKMLGHKHLSTTAIYTKVLDTQKREAANRINLNFGAFQQR